MTYNMCIYLPVYTGQERYTTSFVCVIIVHRIPLVGRREITTAKCKVLTYTAMSPAHKYDKQTVYMSIHLERHEC